MISAMSGALRLRTLKQFTNLNWKIVSHHDVSEHATLHSLVGHIFSPNQSRSTPTYSSMCIRDFLDFAPTSVTHIPHPIPTELSRNRLMASTPHETLIMFSGLTVYCHHRPFQTRVFLVLFVPVLLQPLDIVFAL